MATVEVQYLRNPRTGEHHKIVPVLGGRLTEERDNFDEAGEMEVLTLEAAKAAVAEGGSWCLNCCREEAGDEEVTA